MNFLDSQSLKLVKRSGCLVFFFLWLLSGCSLWPGRYDTALQIAEEHHLQPLVFQTTSFLIQGFGRFSQPAAPLVVYLEGDGAAWQNRYRLAADPTPRNPVALRLAGQDPAANVLYLARPCHYVHDNVCAPRYWSSHRYSEPILQAVGQAIDQAKERTSSRELMLVGYSGGGVIAALLAARRQDVCQLVTVAANLDITRWTQFHHVTPLWGSENPRSFSQALGKIRQVHFVGAEDGVVPLAVVQSYQQALPAGAASRIVVLPGQGHFQGWPALWPTLRQQVAGCVEDDRYGVTHEDQEL